MNYLRSKVFGRKNKKSYVYSNFYLVKKTIISIITHLEKHFLANNDVCTL